MEHLRFQTELLAPAGNLEKLKFAVLYGADAVYIGGHQFGLRSKAGNFSMEDMQEGVHFAHSHGAKVFVVTNIIAHNSDFEGLEAYLKTIDEIGVDAVIVADPAIVEFCKRVTPNMEIHLSTQASTTNAKAVQFWGNEGVKRVVLAREVSMEEIKSIKQSVHDVEIEAFTHGAMCSSYSGRCVLSNHMTNRDANRGGCAQSCRWKYDLYEDGDEQLDAKATSLLQNDDEYFTMSSKDLSMIEHIPDMIRFGVNSLKIEGRMKSVHYVATVVGTYRKVIDAFLANPDGFEFKQEWKEEIMKAATRGTSTAFFYDKPTDEAQIFGQPPKMEKFDFAGLVMDFDVESGIALIEQRNSFQVGQEVEFIGSRRENFTQIIEEMWSDKGEVISGTNVPMQKVRVMVSQPVKPYDIMRKSM
jgi:putative protease